jgi:Flp pilus assembly protein TadG
MSLRSRVRSICRTFRKDEQGAVLVYFSVVALTLVGTVGILVDGARHMTLHSELQNLADAAALAGAAELA